MARRHAVRMTLAPDPHVDAESIVLRDVATFASSAAVTLEALIAPARVLHARLVATATFQRVNGLDYGDGEPIWDLAGTLDVLLDEDVRRVAAYLRRAASLARRSSGTRTHTLLTPSCRRTMDRK